MLKGTARASELLFLRTARLEGGLADGPDGKLGGSFRSGRWFCRAETLRNTAQEYRMVYQVERHGGCFYCNSSRVPSALLEMGWTLRDPGQMARLLGELVADCAASTRPTGASPVAVERLDTCETSHGS
jgi:hypothetical protein